MNKLTLVLILLIACCDQAITQAFGDCKMALQQAFTDMAAIGKEVPKGKTYFLDYTVETKLRDAENEAGAQRIKALFTSDRAVVLNDYAEMYVDKIQTFSVLPKEKKVIWSDAYLGMNQQLQLSYNKQLLDSLLQYSEITICAELEDHTELFWEIELSCTPTGQKKLHYEKVTLLLNRTKRQLAYMHIDFIDYSPMESLMIDFNRIDYEYTGPLTTVDFETRYIQAETLITDRFRHYELVDVRK